MHTRFIALDVETASEDYSSICQIGLATFENNEIISTFKSYVNPKMEYSPWNISVHGITEDLVKEAPTIPEIFNAIKPILENQIIVHHTAFDRTSLKLAAERYGIPIPDCRWLDTARVVRRVWSQFRYSDFGLSNLVKNFNIEYQPHDALEDAIAAGKIINIAIRESGIGLDEWLRKAYESISSPQNYTGDGDPNGPLVGNAICFTGALKVPRREAAELAQAAGCAVQNGVTSKTTILVVGDQDINRLSGHDKSSKHRKAEELRLAGQQIEIIRESDFFELIKY